MFLLAPSKTEPVALLASGAMLITSVPLKITLTGSSSLTKAVFKSAVTSSKVRLVLGRLELPTSPK